MMIRIFWMFILTFIPAVLWAQQPLTLADAVARALEKNYGITIVNQDQQIAEIRNNWGNAGRYPYISLSAGDDNSYNLSESGNSFTNRFSAGVALNWTIFNGYAVRIAKQRYEELEQLSKQHSAIVVESTIQSVVLAYFDVLLQKEKLNTWREVMQLSEDRYNQARERKEFGTYVTYDVLQAQNAYLTDRSGYLLQEVNYRNALRDLAFLMAEKEETNFMPADSFLAIPVTYQLEELQTLMFQNNKVLQNQYVNQRLLENAVASAKSAFSPNVGFRGGMTGNTNRTDQPLNNQQWNNSASMYGNFTLSFNLYSGGTRKRAVEIARIDEAIGVVETAEIQHELNNTLENLFEFYQVRKELLSVATENLLAARLNLTLSKEKFEAGAINSFNFRDVQNIYLNAAQRELEAVYQLIDAQTSLLRLTGTILSEYE